MACMPANSSFADPRHALPASACQLQCGAETLQKHAGGAQSVPTLPVTLAHVQATLDRLAVAMQQMSRAVADWSSEPGQTVDEDALPPEARALQWHLRTTAEALRDSRDACAASREWSHRLIDAAQDAVPRAGHDGLAGTLPDGAPSRARLTASGRA